MLAGQKWCLEGEANSTEMPPEQKANKVELLTYIFMNI
jgi:hypothetical protein